ncbi:MAG TPA: alanine--tRNA ligase, partial [Aliiroseovarius sp.]|nr:alanine--tRNA ligase [Aliiroseovarius sp.]
EKKRLNTVAETLKAQPGEVLDRVKSLLEERKSLQAEVAQMRRELAMSGGKSEGPIIRDVNGIKFAAMVLPGVPGKDLPVLIDAYKTKIGSGAMVLIAENDGKVAVAAGVTDDLKDTFSAVDLVRAAVAQLGGKGGGGRADLAQGGAKDASNAEAAIEAAKKVLGG